MVLALDVHYRDLLGYLPQEIGLYPDFTSRSFLRYMSVLKDIDKRTTHRRIEDTEEHSVEFDITLTYEVSSIGNDFNFKLKDIKFDLELDQWTRTNREIIESDPRGD